MNLISLSEIRKAAQERHLLFAALLGIFYLVGAAGLSFEFSRPLFIALIPFTLLGSFFLMLLFNEERFGLREVLFFVMVAILSFALEVAGVKTHVIFGDYYYGSGLGLKVYDTPLMIGLNWVLMVYSSAAVAGLIIVNPALRAAAAAVLMLLYDILMEQSSATTEMWYWRSGDIPLRNYLTWFAAGLFFQILMTIAGIRIRNRLAPYIYLIQALFFLALIVTACLLK